MAKRWDASYPCRTDGLRPPLLDHLLHRTDQSSRKATGFLTRLHRSTPNRLPPDGQGPAHFTFQSVWNVSSPTVDREPAGGPFLSWRQWHLTLAHEALGLDKQRLVDFSGEQGLTDAVGASATR